MTEPLRVFVNGAGVSVPVGSTVLVAIESADAAQAVEVRAGKRAVVDSRGLPVAGSTVLSGGFVMRIVSAKAAANATPDTPVDA